MTIDIITTNKVLGAGDDGVLHDVQGNVTLTIPNDSTYNFMIEDWIDIFNDSAVNTITISPADGVTLRAKGTAVTQEYGYARVEKIAPNSWIAWGDLVA